MYVAIVCMSVCLHVRFPNQCAWIRGMRRTLMSRPTYKRDSLPPRPLRAGWWCKCLRSWAAEPQLAYVLARLGKLQSERVQRAVTDLKYICLTTYSSLQQACVVLCCACVRVLKFHGATTFLGSTYLWRWLDWHHAIKVRNTYAEHNESIYNTGYKNAYEEAVWLALCLVSNAKCQMKAEVGYGKCSERTCCRQKMISSCDIKVTIASISVFEISDGPHVLLFKRRLLWLSQVKLLPRAPPRTVGL